MGKLKEKLQAHAPLNEIASYLDSLTHLQRLDEMITLSPNDQKKLYEMAPKGLTPQQLVPQTHPPLKPMVFHGVNTLPFFRKFQKRLCRSTEGEMIWGYNEQPFKFLTGPGYFTIPETSDRPGEPMFDYNQIPHEKIPLWPEIVSNQKGMAQLVYGSLKDFLRRISRDVFIGEANKGGKIVGYFVLCREE